MEILPLVTASARNTNNEPSSAIPHSQHQPAQHSHVQSPSHTVQTHATEACAFRRQRSSRQIVLQATGTRQVRSDHIPDTIALLTQHDRQFIQHQLSSPPPEPTYPCDSTFETPIRLSSPHLLLLGTTPQRVPDLQCKHYTPPRPLTRENLCDLQRSLRGNSPSMSSSPSRRSRSPGKSTLGDRMDPKDKLQLFSIFYDDQTPIPSMLEQHVSDLRKPRQAPSPNAKQIRDTAPVARSRSEQDGIDTLEEILLLVPAIGGGMAGVERAAKPDLSAQFLPLASSFVAENIRLETPQPDHCYGYLPSKKARPAKLKATFTIEEENIINRYEHLVLPAIRLICDGQRLTLLTRDSMQVRANYRTLLSFLYRSVEEPCKRADASPSNPPRSPRWVRDRQLPPSVLYYCKANANT